MLLSQQVHAAPVQLSHALNLIGLCQHAASSHLINAEQHFVDSVHVPLADELMGRFKCNPYAVSLPQTVHETI